MCENKAPALQPKPFDPATEALMSAIANLEIVFEALVSAYDEDERRGLIGAELTITSVVEQIRGYLASQDAAPVGQS
jgi:hypothetical protein